MRACVRACVRSHTLSGLFNTVALALQESRLGATKFRTVVPSSKLVVTCRVHAAGLYRDRFVCTCTCVWLADSLYICTYICTFIHIYAICTYVRILHTICPLLFCLHWEGEGKEGCSQCREGLYKGAV